MGVSTGLADLYGHWKKNNLPALVIAEEYDPDRVKITVYTDSDQAPTNRPKVPQKCPKSAQDRPKFDSKSAQGAQEWPKVPQECPKSAPEVPQKFESAYNLHIRYDNGGKTGLSVNVLRCELDTSWHGVQVGIFKDYNPKGYCNFDKAGHDQTSRFN